MDLRGFLKFEVPSVGSMGPFWEFWRAPRFNFWGHGRSEAPFWEPWPIILIALAPLGRHLVSSEGLFGAMDGSSCTQRAIWEPTVEFP